MCKEKVDSFLFFFVHLAGEKRFFLVCIVILVGKTLSDRDMGGIKWAKGLFHTLASNATFMHDRKKSSFRCKKATHVKVCHKIPSLWSMLTSARQIYSPTFTVANIKTWLLGGSLRARFMALQIKKKSGDLTLTVSWVTSCQTCQRRSPSQMAGLQMKRVSCVCLAKVAKNEGKWIGWRTEIGDAFPWVCKKPRNRFSKSRHVIFANKFADKRRWVFWSLVMTQTR